MLSYRSNQKVAEFVLANADKFGALAEKPLAKFVSDFSKAYFKAKTTTLKDLHALGAAIGDDALKSIADKLTPAEAQSVFKKLDPGNSAQAKEDPTWMRGHLAKLLAGEAETAPVIKTARAPRPPAAPKAKRSVMGETDAFSAQPKRRKPRT